MIGIVGACGDLGRQLTIQALAKHPDQVVAYDVKRRRWPASTGGIDPAVKQTGEPFWVDSLADLIKKADIIHWCGYLDGLAAVGNLAPGKLLVLHASVMALSQTARQTLPARRQTVIVHCLMNRAKTVVVASETANRQISQHIESLGLSPQVMTIAEHDHIMACSQGPAAILHELLGQDLTKWDSQGLLVPSGSRFKDALTNSTAHWTPATYDTIRRNPQLIELLERMRAALDDRQP